MIRKHFAGFAASALALAVSAQAFAGTIPYSETYGFIADFRNPETIDHVLCHYSSDHFRSRIFQLLEMAGVMPSEEKWFSNLHARGNTGAANI